MQEVHILSAKRTPIGKFGGSLARITAVELAVAAVRSAIAEAGIAPTEVDCLVLGLARQAGNGPNPARQVSVRSGLPLTTPAYTLNQACASGMAAIAQAADKIRSGECRFVVAAGAESMSRVPYLLDEVRFGQKMGHRKLVDAMYHDGLFCPLANKIMGETVEALAGELGISRAEQDEFALRSQNRAEEAEKAGRFASERIALEALDHDEHPRAGTTMASLTKLSPVFAKDGTLTAGNSSGITDAASALVLSAEPGSKPLARFAGAVTVALEPERMGLGPVPAVRRYLERFGGRLDDFDLVEINEAFAAQVLACQRELKVDPERLNVNGGSIALGHPIGCSGNRVVVTLLHEMIRRGVGSGLATLCVSGGLGMALGLRR